MKGGVGYSGLILVLLAAGWYAWIGGRLTERIPPGWSATLSYIGTQTYADPVTGALPARDVLATYDRSQRVVSGGRSSDSVVVEDAFTIRDLRGDTVVWEYVTRSAVDPRTGALLHPVEPGEIVAFPRNVQRTTYRFRSNYVEGIPLAYTGEEQIYDIPTYVFAYHGRGEFTDSYRGYGKYPGVPMKPGQEIRCADDQFYYRAWVEPWTGELVKLEEGCPSGDFLYDGGSGRVVSAVDRWSGVTTGDGLLRRVDEVRRYRSRYLWMRRTIPAGLLAAGLILLGWGWARRRAEVAA